MAGEKFPRHKISTTPFQPSGQQIVFGVGVDDNERLFRAVMAQGVLRDIKRMAKALEKIRSNTASISCTLVAIKRILKARRR